MAISHIRLFEKGLAHFEGQERRGLERHLMKTQCTELANSLFRFHAQEDQAKKGASSGMGSEERVQVIRKVGKEEGEALLAVHKAIAAEEVATFIEVWTPPPPLLSRIILDAMQRNDYSSLPLFRCLRRTLNRLVTSSSAKVTRRRIVSWRLVTGSHFWRNWRPARNPLCAYIWLFW